MLVSTLHTTHSHSDVLITDEIALPTLGSNTYAQKAPIVGLQVTQTLITATTPVIDVLPAGEGAYPATAAWPMCTGRSNSMSANSALLGPSSSTSAVLGVAGNYSYSSLVVDDADNVYAVAQSGSNAILQKFNAAFVLQWSYTTTNIPFAGTNKFGFSLVLGSNGALYFVTSGGLHSVSAATGVANWVNTLRGTNFYAITNLLLDAEGNIYCWSGGALFCVTPTGSIKWTTFTTAQVASMSLDATSGILYVIQFSVDRAEEANQLMLNLFDHSTGTQLLTPVSSNTMYLLGRDMVNKMLPPVVGSQFVYVNTGRSLVAFTKTGAVAWSVPVWIPLRTTAAAMVYNEQLNIVYVSNTQSGVTLAVQKVAWTALDGTTGLRLYESAQVLTTNTFVVQPVIDSANNLYVYDSAGVFRVFNAALTQVAAVTQAATFGAPPPLALTVGGKLLAATSAGIYVVS